MTNRQLALALPHRPAFGFEDFLVARCNEAAVGWLDRWPDWPMRALLLVGPAGSGKSHLVRVWAERSGAPIVAAERYSAAVDARCLVIEDADRGLDEEALFHAFNRLAEQDGSLLLTARAPLAAWPVILPDLRSRLQAAGSVRLDGPDDELLAALLVKQFADRQIDVHVDLISYLVARMERTFSAVGHIVGSLDAAALVEKRPVTVPFARRVLGWENEGKRSGRRLTDA
ncbi:HdaA/DnaA family protein [Oceanibacterium hippocampi]|uniref:Chromosomal replication initiator protein DnaA n=1 Tax=Oceanibacterium hippocampi TaxID=745714 RepID=A0A1Y5SXC8_9PROT|nr:DnaA/Hda family protein [Oceanibacterium hippocampi]SLN48700.1 Chromosomal replication initiator protein DnaA [Oceanibacterium hippocampi]